MRAWSLLAWTALLSACGGGGGDAGAPINTLGTLRLSLADAPACGMSKVFVTVQRVRVHTSSSAGENDGGWVDITPAAPLRVDLLTLTNGTLAALGEARLPAGSYQQLRLVLAENGGATPLANAVVPAGATSELELETPSALQSGLKINTAITVAAGQVADWAIDFDACKSIVKAGNSGRYLLKPVLTALPLLGDAGQRVVGFVDSALAHGAATVSVQQNGLPLRATPTDASGKFVLYPVPAGNYQLVISANGRATAVMNGVPVTTTAITTLGGEAARLIPPASAMAELSGVITLNGQVTSTSGSVRALQNLSGGPAVEAAYAAADASTGRYTLRLPTAAPVQLAYQAGATSFPWAPSVSEAGKYKLEAKAGDKPVQSFDLTLTGNAVKDFSF
ncbi:hypothetical protein HNQ51_002459 [Inhella inkyongensis]|uniref:DUF4382 domain-containing protein n=1 Tax=Inhella inkyongensis TaxID=392593 RepID=A0A840S9R9_9BURK|nr:DUF4382 domain-containing protein [Inhella inkyongensis]MBB5205140.1 hypothetical protein [Inhella inkyongensis]